MLSMLDFRKRSVITSDLRVCSDYHNENKVTANTMATHSSIAYSINPFQVVVMNKYHVAVRYMLCSSS
jgi:hypothetical protein